MTYTTELSIQDCKEKLKNSGYFKCKFYEKHFTAYYSGSFRNSFNKCFDGSFSTDEIGNTVIMGKFRYFKSVLLFLLFYNIILLTFTSLLLFSILSNKLTLPTELWFLLFFPLIEVLMILIGTKLSKEGEKYLVEFFITELHCTQTKDEDKTNV